jgi:hypothetical protein
MRDYAGTMDVIAEVADPDGVIVELTRARWEHIIDGHPELASLQDEVMRAIADPTRRVTSLPWSGEAWFYLSSVGPSRWLKVVVLYESGRGRIITAFARRAFP